MPALNVAGRVPALTVLASALLWPWGAVLETHALAADGRHHQPPACATASLDDLKRLCPVPSEAVSEECLAALERRYVRRPVYCDLDSAPGQWRWYRRWQPLPRKEVLVWADVFEDVAAVRGKVEAAMADPACRLREHEFRADLRQRCAADAMARLAVLHRACRGPITMEDEANPYFHGWPLAWAERRATIEEHGDEDYWRLIARLEESELHFAWRMTKCRAVPKPVLEELAKLRPPSIYVPADQYDLLMVAAARLGNPWAIARTAVSIGIGIDAAVAIEMWPDAPLPLAYVAFAFQAASSLPYFLAAREEDRHSEAPWFDWHGFEQSVPAEEIKAAMPAAERIRAQGWPPCCKPQRGDSPWPWTDLPTVLSKKYMRRRIDEEGNVRWVHRSGTEEWLKDGVAYMMSPDGEESMQGSHSRIAMPTVRRWTDAEGTERWVDEWGDEHWLDADGTEHWIKLDGTEWILLPVGEPFPPEPGADSQ